MINSFTGKHAFLSNFYPYRIRYDGYYFPSSENAYQAAKIGPGPNEQQTPEWVQHQLITPAQSKKLGKKLPLRADWEQVKDQIMYNILLIKFSNPHLAEMLLNTGDEELIEGNWWNDTYWGVCNGVGQNKLGKILMNIRAQKKIQNT